MSLSDANGVGAGRRSPRRPRSAWKQVRGHGRKYHITRTLEWLTDAGCLAEKVEKRALIIRPGMPPGMARIGPTQDLFGCVDIVALSDVGVLLVQVCAWDGLSQHRKKIRETSFGGLNICEWVTMSDATLLLVAYRLMESTTGTARRWDRHVEWWSWRTDGTVQPNVWDITEIFDRRAKAARSEKAALARVLRREKIQPPLPTGGSSVD